MKVRTVVLIFIGSSFIASCNGSPSVQEPSETSALSTSVPTRSFPSSSPTPTSRTTLAPTSSSQLTDQDSGIDGFPVATPQPNLDNYSLSSLAVEDAINSLSSLESLWDSIVSNAAFYPDAYNPLKKHVAFVDREVQWRFPNTDLRQDLEWQMVRNLAQSGDQSATLLLRQLLQDQIDSQSQTIFGDDSNLDHPGFHVEWEPAPNLFGDGADAWVSVFLISSDSRANNAGGGAVFAFRQLTPDSFEVLPLYGYWQPYFSSDPTLLVADHTMDGIPEIIVTQDEAHGVGPGMVESWFCGYQWKSGRWLNLLGGSQSEQSVVDNYETLIDAGCLVVEGFMNYSYDPIPGGNADLLNITKSINPFGCDWSLVTYLERWTGEGYRQRVSIEFPESIEYSDELTCLWGSWQWISELDTSDRLLELMENTLPNVQDLTPSGFPRTFFDQYRFMLGRLYALSGAITKAKNILTDLVESPADPEDTKWVLIAQGYLDSLSNIAEAERDLTSTLSPTPPPSESIDMENIADRAAVLLFEELSPKLAKEYIQVAISEGKMLSMGQFECNQQTREDLFGGEISPVYLLYQNDCASIQYLLALSMESLGEISGATIAFYELWKEYPESFYAFIARERLESE